MAVGRILSGVALMALMGVWSWHANPNIDLADLLSEPDRYDGAYVEGFGEATVAELTPGGFMIQTGEGLRVEILSDVAPAPVGTYVTVAGHFRAPARVEAEAVRFAEGRRWKMVVSVVPLAALVLAHPRFMRFRRTGIELRGLEGA